MKYLYKGLGAMALAGFCTAVLYAPIPLHTKTDVISGCGLIAVTGAFFF